MSTPLLAADSLISVLRLPEPGVKLLMFVPVMLLLVTEKAVDISHPNCPHKGVFLSGRNFSGFT